MIFEYPSAEAQFRPRFDDEYRHLPHAIGHGDSPNYAQDQVEMHHTASHGKSPRNGDSSHHAEDDIPQYPAIRPVEFVDGDGDLYRRAELTDDAFLISFGKPLKNQRQQDSDRAEYLYPLNDEAAD